jgi:hypothetical protein
MFAAAFPNATLTDWETDSIVIHLKSSSGVAGPYEYSDTVAAPRREATPSLWDSLDCHNPTVHKLGDECVSLLQCIIVAVLWNLPDEYRNKHT